MRQYSGKTPVTDMQAEPVVYVNVYATPNPDKFRLANLNYVGLVGIAYTLCVGIKRQDQREATRKSKIVSHFMQTTSKIQRERS